jgi:hypothetical protein
MAWANEVAADLIKRNRVMRYCRPIMLVSVLLAVLSGGCPTATLERNPFLTYVETFTAAGGASGGGQGGGQAAEENVFRPSMDLTFVSEHPTAVVETSFVAWVSVSSIRSAEQQDVLLANNYVQLVREVRLGTAFTLPVGTFVYNGPGTAGATAVVLSPTGAVEDDGDGGAVTTQSRYSLVTPDAILVFSEPPVSCDTVAFTYAENGQVATGPATGQGGYKTLAQVDVYQCEPFRPGVFFKISGGAAEDNEYMEGESVTFTFRQTPTAEGAFAVVTISGAAETTSTETP